MRPFLEITKRFGDAMNIILFHGNSVHVGDFRRKRLIVNTTAALKTKLWVIDSKDAASLHMIILSTYAT